MISTLISGWEKLLHTICRINCHHGAAWVIRPMQLCKVDAHRWNLHKVSHFRCIDNRMGAFDNMLRGESTFMYEMNETAEIIKCSTPKSLVVLDEIGRGTATFDGFAIAQAVLRHFVDERQCLTLFVTHYPQVREIANERPGQVGTCHMGFMESLSLGNSCLIMLT